MLSVKDIKTYSESKRIPISDYEANIIYEFIKTYYNDLLEQNTTCFNNLKQKIRPDLFDNIINIYNENKIKFLN